MPANDADVIPWLRLNRIRGLGPRLQRSLLDRFGSPEAVFAARPEELLQVRGVKAPLVEAIRSSAVSDAQLELRRCRQAGVRILTCQSASFPRLLQEIPDPPPVLYVRGSLVPQDELAVAIVGSRHCTAYGEKQAYRLAYGLAAAGVTVISGLARGIDAEAHKGALAAGGRTLAVLAADVTKVYPAEHRDLAEQVVANGALLSESPLGRASRPGMFPQRNRLISGLSLGVVVVEAGERSGALHTARHAVEQNRDVFAVPGPIDSPASAGCHALIRDGAVLVRGVEDVLEHLGPLARPVPVGRQPVESPRELTLGDQERDVLRRIPGQPVPVDNVLAEMDLEASRVLATLTVLEMKRFIRRLPGGFVIRVE